MSKLNAGLYIAQGSSTNILILLGGKSPMLEFLGGIDLNHFKATGKVRELTKTSLEIVDILDYPEKYSFELPSVTDAVNNVIGIGTTEFQSCSISKEELLECVAHYKELIPLYDDKSVRSKMLIWLFETKGIAINNGNYLLVNKILPLVRLSHEELRKISE